MKTRVPRWCQEVCDKNSFFVESRSIVTTRREQLSATGYDAVYEPFSRRDTISEQALISSQQGDSRVYEIEPDWSSKEFAGIDLGDKRLNERFLSLSADLAAQPQAPINQACEDWASTKAAYRFFDNKKSRPELILSPHQQQTRERMSGYSQVLAVQDTVLLNYSHHPVTQGLGPIGTPEQDLQGLVMHHSLVCSPHGLPLGLATQESWSRDECEDEQPQEQEQTQEAKKKKKNKARPIEEKESFQWIKALRGTVELSPAGVEVVTIADREADVYEFFQAAEELETTLLVRATHDRVLVGGGKLRSVMKAEPVAGRITVEVPAQKDQPARKALCEVRSRSVTLRPPYRPKEFGVALSPIQVDAVSVHEVDPPARVKEPLDWMLLTTVPVKSVEDALERVRWYKVRWNIEVWHKVLKSGCKVEECRLETGERLMRYLTLMSVIAWRVFWMVQMNRQHPEAPGTVVFTEPEWKALYAAIHRTTQLPETLPTIAQVVRWMAQLGGFLGRKHDHEPGVTVVWRGWQRLHDLVIMWLVVHGAGNS